MEPRTGFCDRDEWNHKEHKTLFERKHEAYTQALGAIALFLNARAADEVTGKRDDLQPHIQRFVQYVAELKQILEQLTALRSNDPQDLIIMKRPDEGELVPDWLCNRSGEKEMTLLCSAGTPVKLPSDILRLAQPRQMMFDDFHVHYILRWRFALSSTVFQNG